MNATEVLSGILLGATSAVIRVGLSLKACLLAWALLGFFIFGATLKAGEFAMAVIPPLLCLIACLVTVKALTATQGHPRYQIIGLALLIMPLRWLQLS